MEMNYWIVGIATLAVIWLIIFLIRKNQKDKKDFEKYMNKSELKPEKHDEDKEKI